MPRIEHKLYLMPYCDRMNSWNWTIFPSPIHNGLTPGESMQISQIMPYSRCIYLFFHNQLDINPLSTTGAVYCSILCIGIYANKYSWRGAYKHNTKHKEDVSVWESHFCQCWCHEFILLNNRWPSLKSQFSRSVLLCWTSSALVTMICKLAVLYMVLTEYFSFFPSAFLLSHNIYLFCHALNHVSCFPFFLWHSFIHSQAGITLLFYFSDAGRPLQQGNTSEE